MPDAIARSGKAMLCYGAQGPKGEPWCDGKWVRKITAREHQDSKPFTTDWCSGCRAEARALGYVIIADHGPVDEEVSVVELAMLAHLLQKHKNFIVVGNGLAADREIMTVTDYTGELHPSIYIELR
jgi:hypothetical protein